MIDYPKMLYKGSIAESTIVNDEHEEQAALQAGYVEHDDLPDDVPSDDALSGSYLPDDDEEYIVELQLELEQLQAENAELREKVAAYENQRTDEQTQAPADTDSTDAGQVDYSEWTNSQLQEAITKAGKIYKSGDKKPQLIAILEGAK